MGRQSKRKQQRRMTAQCLSAIEQARQTWLGKLVQFDLQRGYGVQYGRVIQITDEGDVFVECRLDMIDQ